MVLRSRLLLVGSLALGVVGCAGTAPSKPALALAMPEVYQAALPVTASAAADAVKSEVWWQAYGSSELNRLISQALTTNPDLKIAASQVVQARLRADQVGAGRLPTLTAPVRAAVGSGTGGEALQNSQASLQGTYRVDIWGEQSAQSESAERLVWRAIYERENLQRNLTSALVSTYISYLVASDSVSIARENETIAKDILQTVERRTAAGDATLEELEQQRTALYLQQATLPGLENQREDLRNALSRLVGVLPRDIVLLSSSVDQLTTPTVDVGLPSRLLLNRPDIRVVEARMQAANANIAVARARLLPPVDLALQSGYNGLGLGQLLQPQNLFWNGVASLAVTIFDGGRRDADKALAQAAYEEMVITYGQTVYQAIRDVESALTGLRSANLRLDAQKRATRSALSLLGVNVEAYSLGATDLMTLLEARRAYQRSMDESKRAKADALNSYAKLSQALGMENGSETVERYSSR